MNNDVNNFEPLTAESEHRIKEMVKEKMKRINKEKQLERKRKQAKQLKVAAVAATLVIAGAVAYNSDTVKASVAKLFGFVPGQGVVQVEPDETETPTWYVMERKDASAGDEMVQVEIKDAYVANGELELHYTVDLSKITDQDIENVYASLDETNKPFMELYQNLGYDNYFSIQDADQVILPQSSAAINGTKVKVLDTTITGNESTDSLRKLCIVERYDVKDVLKDNQVSGTLTLGSVEVSFALKNLELGSPSETVDKNGLISEIDGLQLLCVPTWKDNKLYTDFYAYDLGEYQSVYGFRMRGENTDVLVADDVTMAGEIDDSYMFNIDGSSRFGPRIFYEFDKSAEALKDVVFSARGLYVEKAYEDKIITLKDTPKPMQSMQETVKFDAGEIEIVEMHQQDYGIEDGLDELEHGYLVLKYRIKQTDNKKMLVDVMNMSINGNKVEYVCTEFVDGTYFNCILPLDMPYEDVKTIGFDSVMFKLMDRVEFELK